MDLTTTVGYVPGFATELNLRELGGLPTDDGRTVRRGLFYRGSSLVGLSAQERALVDAMGLRFVLDLRAAGEASGKADYLAEGTDYQRIGGMRFEDGSEVDFSPEAIAKFEQMDPNLFEDGTFMERLYVNMAFDNPALQTLVEHVASGEVPVYFHCTAGKDRTGVSALVVNLLLGVTHEAIMGDFLLTNEYRRSIIEAVADNLPPDTPPEIIERWQKANGVNESDLLAVMRAIDERYGSVEAYFQGEYGIDGQALAALRDRYLE